MAEIETRSGPERAGAPAARSRPGRRSSLRRYLPPQHGAWAMLLLPYLCGVIVAGPRWPDAPLLGAWMAGYLLSYYALQAVKTRRPHRFRPQLVAYGVATVPLGGLVVAARPAVLWYAPAYAALLAINAWFAWRRQERALLNDLASVLQSCLLVFVVATIAGAAPRSVLPVFAAMFAYFAGTVLYVKTMIRERESASYRRWSVAYHVAALVLAGWLGPLVAAVFAVLLVRAWLLAGRPLTPKRVGLLEIVNCVLLLAAVVLTWA